MGKRSRHFSHRETHERGYSCCTPIKCTPIKCTPIKCTPIKWCFFVFLGYFLGNVVAVLRKSSDAKGPHVLALICLRLHARTTVTGNETPT